jgi:hypothetical protein
MSDSVWRYWRNSSSSKAPPTNLFDFSSQKPMARMESMTDASSVPTFAGPLVPMNCLTSLAWPGKIDIDGRETFVSNMTEEKT